MTENVVVWRVEHPVTGAGPFQADQVCPYVWDDCDCGALHLDIYRPGEWRASGFHAVIAATGDPARFLAGCVSLDDLRTWFTFEEMEELAGHGYVIAAYATDQVVIDTAHRQVAFTGTRTGTQSMWTLYPLGFFDEAA